MLMLGGGDGMSEVYMLKRVGESTPRGTPVLNWRCVDVLLLYVVKER